MDIITSEILWEILKHAKSWLANLVRASDKRKEQSVSAVRDVIKASRETAVYMRTVKELGTRKPETEARLSVLWTKLGFALQDIGIHKLAKRCEIRGKLWANPTQFDQDFLDKADVSLESIEGLAHQILAQIKH